MDLNALLLAVVLATYVLATLRAARIRIRRIEPLARAPSAVPPAPGRPRACQESALPGLGPLIGPEATAAEACRN